MARYRTEALRKERDLVKFSIFFLLTDSRSNKYSSKIEDTRHIHTTYILLQIKYNNIYCTKKEVHSHTQL